MKLKYSLALFLSMLSSFLFAQGTLKGKVIDALTKKPLTGATIAVAGKNVTTTDNEGAFSVACTANNEVTVSFVGYESYSRRVKDCNETLSVMLVPSNASTLSNVEITSTSAQNKSLLYQPASISKLAKTELTRGQGLFLDDAININIPGVTMSRRTVSAGQQFNIRGYGNGVRGTNGISSNFDGQGYKVYLNGIPITDAEGITLMDDIDFGSIGNVEVVKGPAGSLYGLAVSGVVNLNTIKPERGKTTIGQDVMFGNYGLQRFTTHLQTATDKSSLLLNYGYQHSDGFMQHTESEKRFVNASGEFNVSPKQSLSFYASYSYSYDQRGGELTIDQYNKKDYTGNPEYIKRNAHSNVIGFRAGISHTYNFTSNISNTTSLFALGQSQNVSSAGGWTDKDPINAGLRSTLDMKFNLNENTVLSGITGIEMQRQQAQTIGYNMVANPSDPNGYWIIGAMRSNQFTKSSTTSLFTEWTLALAHDFSITGGVGVSNMVIDLNDRFYVANSTKPTRYTNTYDGMVSPHLAVNKVFSKELSVYASYSKGYKAPVSSYFFIPTTGQVNTGLKPEIGDQFEIGTKGSLFEDRLSYSLALFQTKFKDKMTSVAVPLTSTTTAYSYVANGGDQNHKGIEASASYALLRSSTGFIKLLRPFANIAYSDFKYENYQYQKLNSTNTGVIVVDYSGLAVAGVPKVATNFGVDLSTKVGLYANLTYSFKDGFPISSDGLYNTSSYNLLNGKIGIARELGKHFSIDGYFGVTNITGVQYPLMVFVNQLPDAYLPAPLNTNYFGGLNLKYIF